jgi:hypothetical protein
VPVVSIGGYACIGLWGRNASLAQPEEKYAKRSNVSLLGVSVCQKGGTREASWHLEAELHSIAQCPAMVKGKEIGKNGGIQKVMISRTLKYTLATAILLAVMLVVTVVPVATAKTDTAAKPVDGAAIDRMIEKLEPFVTRCDDGTFRLDIPKDAKIDKAGREFRTVSAGMAYINSLIQDGTLVSTPNLSVYSANDGQFALQSNNRDEFKWRWYGFEVWICHDCLTTMCYMGEAAAAIAFALALFPSVSTPAAYAVGTCMIVSSRALLILDNGCGVHLKFCPSGGVVPFVPFYFAAQTCK